MPEGLVTGVTRVTGSCPNLETVASYVDGTLEEPARAEVEAHIAECEDCYELVAELLHSTDTPAVLPFLTPAAVGEQRDDRGWKSRSSRRTIVAAGAALAAAAALVVAVRVGPPWWDRFSGGTGDPQMERLIAAVGDERAFDGRLSAGFTYGIRRSPVRSGSSSTSNNLSLLAAAGEIQAAAHGNPTAANLHAFGVAQLLLGQHQNAVESLERAVESSPARADILSDLSAAYLERARVTSAAEDWPKALATAEKAIRANPNDLSAWFNRACAIESFGVSSAGREAWNDYLQRDSQSPWATEARERLSRLKPESDASERWKQETVRYLSTPATSEQAALLVALNPQASRELLEDEIWPAIAATGNPAERDRLRRHAIFLVEPIMARTNDNLLRETHVSMRSDSSVDPRLRDAWSHWRAARSLYAANRMVDMTSRFAEASAAFQAAGSPHRLWADHYRLVGLFYQGKLAEAERIGQQLKVAAERGGYSALLPRVRWDLGTLMYQQARFEDALAYYRAAGEGFEAIGEFENATAINRLMGEALGRLGDARGSWSFHRRALAQFDMQQTPRQRHTLLAGAAHSALNLGMGEAALALFRAAIPNALAWNSPPAILEAYLNQARAQLVLDDRVAAKNTLDLAKSWLGRVPDQAMADRFGADFALAEAEVLLEDNARAGVEATDRALERYRTVASEYRLSALHLLRGRLHARLGDDQAAERDLINGIEILESKRARVSQRSLRVSFLDTVWGLYDDIVSLEMRLGRTDAALGWSERGRARTLLDVMSEGGHQSRDLAKVSATLDPDEALIYFHATTTDLLTWLVTRQGSEVHRQPATRESLTSLIAGLQRSFDRGVGDLQVSARLFDLLLKPLRLEERGATRLIVVPHGQLEFVPFAGLWDEGRQRYVVQDYTVTLVPSLSTYLALHGRTRRHAPQSIVVLTTPPTASVTAGLPRLDGAVAEAESIKTLYKDGRVVEPDQATESALLTALERADVVHFGGHAIPDAAFPWHARLLLAPEDGGGGAYRIETLPSRIRAGVVVLAACRTARGAPSWGEGVTSLVTPFLQSGVGAVVATLADVEDEAMRTLTTAFHRFLVGGAAPGDALRMAQLSVIGERPGAVQQMDWAAVTAYGVR